jgi:ABC-type multidrug transport system ATPase subunit
VAEGVTFVDASRSFGAHRALDGVSFACEPDGITCLVGPNGAGKSTALSMAAGLLAPSSGRVLIDGDAVHTRGGPDAVGYLPQRSVFPEVLTVREIVEFVVAARRVEGELAARLFEDAGLEAVRERRIGELSGGWVRRVGIHVAQLGLSKTLLLDEPFVGLDPSTLDGFVAYLLERQRAGDTLLLSSHDFDTIDCLGARLVVLDEGRVVGVACPAANTSRATYRRILAGEPS